MEKQVIFRDRQEVQAADFTNLEAFVNASIKHVVADGISVSRKFTGFGVTASTQTELTVATGRLYQSGDVYTLDTVTTFNMFQYLAVATKKVVALVSFGEGVETSVQPRDFIIDLTTGATEPEAVSMEYRKQARLSLVTGVESADPVAPSIGENTVLIALVTMNTTGIENIDFQLGNVLPQAEANQQDVTELNNWRDQVGPQVDNIQTQIAALREASENKVDRANFSRLSGDVARLKEKSELPDGAADYSSDSFGDATKTDDALSAGTYLLDAGLQFPNAGQISAPLQLFNPIDTKVKRSATDFILPDYTEEAKVQTKGYAGDISLSQYQAATRVIKVLKRYVYRYYYGWRYYPNNWWRYYVGRYYPYYWYRGYYGYWVRYPTVYYSTVSTTANFNGVMVAQTFLAPNAFWLSSIGIYLTQIAAAGDITVGVCETELGQPNIEKTITRATIARADLLRYPKETKIPVPPVYMEAGKRYAIFIITEGSHRAAIVSGNSFTQGTFFYSSDQAWFQGDLTKDLMFNLNGAAFTTARTVVELGSVSLAGGITDIVFNAEMVVPDGSELNFEIQVGGIWYPLTDVDKLTVAKPDIVPLRAVFVGTRDAAPGVQLGADSIVASRPATSFTHFSTLRTLGAPSDEIEVKLRIAGWNGGAHTVAVQLTNNAGGSPSSPSLTETTTEANEDGEVITVKRFVFTLGAPISSYKIKTSGTGSTGVAPFSVIDRVDVVL